SQAPSATPILEVFDFEINWGDGSPIDTGTATIDTAGVNIGDIVAGSFDGTHTYADDGVYTVEVTINDDNGGTDTKTLTITVGNVDPTLAISGAATIDEGSEYTLNLAASDPGDDTITSLTINCAAGTETVTGNPT